jgi:hypothetical protein
MSDTPEKRRREAQKIRKREVKAQRKRLRKEGLLGPEGSGLFHPGEFRREIVAAQSPEKPPESAPPPDSPGSNPPA